MASQHIEVQSTVSRLSLSVRQFVDAARALQELGAKVKDIADQVASSSDWAALAVKLGTSEIDAETAYNLLTNIQGDLTTANYDMLIDRLG
jgi:hypothetical protein